MKKISVIIPVYNVEKYLGNCIESVLAQDFSDYEVILVDDGSTDKSGIICDEFAAKHSEIRVIHQKNKGQGGARNTGIENAEGEYLLFVDSDDSIKGNMFSFLYDTAVQNNSDIVFFGMDCVDEDNNIISTRKPINNGIKNLVTEEKMYHFITDTYPWDKLYKADLLTASNVRYPERVWYEDFCFLMKIAPCTDKVTLTDKVFYNYLQRDNSTMHVKNTDRNSDMLTVVSDILSFYRENKIFDKYYNELCFMTVMHMMILCTLRVATEDVSHPLLKQFYEFTYENFPDFKKNKYVKCHLTRRHRVIFAFTKRRMYGMLKLLNRLNKLR